MSLQDCIYCRKSFDPNRGQGDHIIPVQFGEFRNAKRFRGCCSNCNNEIGKSEEQLLRCGPESVFLREFKPALPRKRDRGPRSPVGAHGSPPPKHAILHDEDHEELVVVDEASPYRVRPVEHLAVKLKSGEMVYIKLFPTMTETALRRGLSRHAKAIIEPIMFHCEKENQDHYLGLLKKISPACKVVHGPDTRAGVRDVTVKTHLRVSGRYFRAIAKMGLHYYLSHSLRGLNGSDPVFASIREFIRNGGDPEDHVRVHDISFGSQISSWLQRNIGNGRRCHILGLEDSITAISALVKMFHGDDRSVCYRIKLGSIISCWTYEGWRAHAFLYDQTQSESGSAGAVHELPF